MPIECGMKESCDLCGDRMVTDLEHSVCIGCGCRTPLTDELRILYKYRCGCKQEALERKLKRKT
jgi:hypothetical protein